MISCAISLISKFKSDFFTESGHHKPQRIHFTFVPRVGGLAVFIGSLAPLIMMQKDFSLGLIILFCSTPVFIIGTLEDLTHKIGVHKRLIFAILSSSLAVYYLNLTIIKIDIPPFDYFLNINLFAEAFTIFAITGLINSYNIIDGLNGLSSMLSIIALLFIAALSLLLNDYVFFLITMIFCSAIFGFFLVNYPFGKIFLGDGGAYLCGFLISILSCLLVQRNPQVSPWFPVLLNAYPIIETIFSIYRRVIHQKTSPGSADRLHLHSLIFRRIFYKNSKAIQHFRDLSNPKSSSIIWSFSLTNSLLAIFFYDDSFYLILIFICSYLSYLMIYRNIIFFNSKITKFFKSN